MNERRYLYYEEEQEDIRTGRLHVRMNLVEVWHDNGRYYIDESCQQFCVDEALDQYTPERRAQMREELFTLAEKGSPSPL